VHAQLVIRQQVVFQHKPSALPAMVLFGPALQTNRKDVSEEGRKKKKKKSKQTNKQTFCKKPLRTFGFSMHNKAQCSHNKFRRSTFKHTNKTFLFGGTVFNLVCGTCCFLVCVRYSCSTFLQKKNKEREKKKGKHPRKTEEMRGPLQLSIELPVSAGTVSRPKKLNVSVSNGFLRLASGDKEKCNRSLANATVTHLGGGRVEIKFEKVAKVRSIKSPRSPFPGKNKFQNSPSLVLFVGEADLEHWLSVLSHADGVLSSSSANSARKTSGENATAMLRYLLEINASQEAFWKENGLK
jgi:hypothetical protein